MLRGILRIAEDGAHIFWCPGCRTGHRIFIGEGPGPRWSFNGDYDRPTFRASVLVTWSEPSDDPDEFDDPAFDHKHVCHSFVTDGNIEFLADSTHGLGGQTVALKPFGAT